MKTILENLKLILTCLTSIVAVIALGWYAYAYLDQTYLEEKKFEDQCVMWKSEIENVKIEIAGVRTEINLNKWQNRLYYLEKRIYEYDLDFGPNCQRCNPSQRQNYLDWKREHNQLQQNIHRAMSGG